MPDLVMLDMKAVGEMLGLSSESVKRLVRDGKLNVRMHKNKYVCTKKDVDDYIEHLPKPKPKKEPSNDNT